jgi:flagella basal body P-ring formation protein FlgA
MSLKLPEDAAVRATAALDLSLDLAELTVEAHERSLKPGYVKRAPAGIRMDGASATQVTWQAAHSAEQRALDTVRSAVADHLTVPVDDVVVQLSQPLPADVAERIGATAADELTARVTTAVSGRTRVDLWISDGRGGQRATPIAVELRFRQVTPVAARPIAARQTVAAADVVLETRELPQRGAALSLEQVTGKSLRRSVAAGEILTERDLIAPVKENDPVLIKPRDAVRLTARKGNLLFSMPGAEALQSGRMGEMVRVRNTASGKIVLGRVTGPGEVEVPL